MTEKTTKSNKIDIDIEIKKAIIHDFHKLKGASHNNNNKLNTYADRDASYMSRPIKKGKHIYPDNSTNYRLTLNGNMLYTYSNENREKVCNYIISTYKDTNVSSEDMYKSLLNCNILSLFNESPELPFTSLKYHTILTTVLHYHYIKGFQFNDLSFMIKSIDNINEDNIYNILLLDKENNIYFTIESNVKNLKRVGVPMMNFGDVISRIDNYLNIDEYTTSNLRRIKSWSTGLQYYDDICRGCI